MVARPRKRKSRRASGLEDKDGGGASPENETGGGDPSADECPACDAGKEVQDRDLWVLCDQCKTWYHWFCTTSSADYELASIDKWCGPPSPAYIVHA